MSPTSKADRAVSNEAMVAEARAHYQKARLLADPDFHEGNLIGLKQLESGQTVRLEDLRGKYGRRWDEFTSTGAEPNTDRS
jgi:hypothetical protein